jgi:hypothetical protein
MSLPSVPDVNLALDFAYLPTKARPLAEFAERSGFARLACGSSTKATAMARAGSFLTPRRASLTSEEQMQAEWLETADKNICLCCGQRVSQPGQPITPGRAARAMLVFNALGLTREDLLGKHREQIDYQSPGFASWLEGQ